MNLLTSSDINTLIENSLLSLSQSLESIKTRDSDALNGNSYFAAAYRYRSLAICRLLLEGSQKEFFINLCKSAYLWCFFLREKKKKEPPKSIFECTSLALPLVDALAAGNIAIAKNLGILLSNEHNPEFEYEDDFLRYHFLALNTLALNQFENVNLKLVLIKWEKVLDGKDDPYFDVCKALFEKDDGNFFEAFSNLILHRKSEVEEWKNDFSFDPQVLLVEGNIFMNGLAILRLADLMGIDTEPNYEMIPNMSRLSTHSALPPENCWQEP